MESVNVIIVIFGTLGTVNNGLLLLIFWFNPLKTFHSNSTYFIKSLTAADFMTSLLTVVWGLKSYISTVFLHVCQWSLWVSVQVSLYMVFVMSVERYIAIKYPFKKCSIVTKKRTMTCITVVWLFSAFSSAITEISSIQYQGQFVLYTLFDLAVLGVTIAYGKIIVELRRVSNDARSRNNQNKTLDSTRMEQIKKDNQLLVVVSILVAILFLTVFPYTLASQVFMGTLSFCPNCPQDGNLVKFSDYYFPIEILNFVVNPFVYAIRLPNYRKSLIALFRCCHGQSQRNYRSRKNKNIDESNVLELT